MTTDLISPQQLDSIIKKTVYQIENGKKQIFEISEEARNESKALEERLELLKERVKNVLSEVEQLEKLEKKSRRNLLFVSKNFSLYGEEDIKKAYNTTRDLQIKLALKREHEQQIIDQRTELEIRIRKARETLNRAEYLVSHVVVAMNFLTSTLTNITATLDNLQRKELLGMKIIIAQEEERQRVARDIHDGPAQSMSNIVLKCEISEKLIDVDVNRARNEIKELKQLVRESLQEIRRIIFDLRPMSLDDLGLIPTLQQYINNFTEETGVHVNSKFYNQDIDIDPIIEGAIFRVVQEALNNIKKHSKASQATVQIKIANETIFLIITDNGVGFESSNILNEQKNDPKIDGFGIYGMRQRTELLKGKFNIQSECGKGTILKLEIPINSFGGEGNHVKN